MIIPIISSIASLLIISFILIALWIKRKDDIKLTDAISSLSKAYGVILVPLLLGYISFHVQLISNNIETQKHDLSIMQEFQSIYFCTEKKELALQYINLVREKKTRIELRKYVIWNLLKTNIKTTENIGQHFIFDRNLNDWQYLAATFRDLHIDNSAEATNLFTTLITDSSMLYGEFTSNKELCRLLKFLHDERNPTIKVDVDNSLICK